MSERFKEPVLKTGDGATHRGFESHSLRQKGSPPKGWGSFLAEGGIRKAGHSVAGVKKCPVDTFLGRGRIHCLMNAPGTGVGIRLLFVAGK